MSCCRGSSISISQPWSWKYGRKRWTCTVEPRFNERLYPRYNERYFSPQ